MKNYYFNQNEFEQPQNTYLKSYLTSQKGAFFLIENNFCKIDPELEEFIVSVKTLINDLNKRCLEIQKLMSKNNCENFPLSKSISDVLLHTEEVDDEVISLVNNSQLARKKNVKFNLIFPLVIEIQRLQNHIDTFIDEVYNPNLN